MIVQITQIDNDKNITEMEEIEQTPHEWIYSHISSDTIYEMMMLTRGEQPTQFTEEDYREQLERTGRMNGPYYDVSIGYYPTFKQAEEAIEMAIDSAYDGFFDIGFTFIRQKASHMQMPPEHYLKEWSYGGSLCLHDESLVGNYDLDHNRFFGRPADMVKHRIGEIVQVVSGYDTYWGIVCALPPTPERVAEMNRRALEKGHLDGPDDSLLDFSDDCYIILTNGGSYLESHEHVLSHHVFWSDITPPDFVRKTLEEGLRRCREESGKDQPASKKTSE